MKKRLIRYLSAILCIVMLLQLCLTGCSKKEELNLDNGYTTENLSLYEVPEWFRDAKFGIFIHYGVYSVSAYGDEWYGHHMYIPDSISYGGDSIYNYHLETYGGASKFGYKDFIPEFAKSLEKYKENNMAEVWAELFEQAGAKYVMPVGIHHDSFALYNSDVQTTYNSVNYGNIDYVSELQKACKKRDIKFGISNHFVENDWFFDDAYAEGTDLAEKNDDGSLVYGELYGDGESKSNSHIHKWFDISMEIINKYHPDMIYYDFDLCNEALNKYDDANRYLMLANYYNQALENNPDGVACCYKHDAFTQAQALLDKERSSLGDIAPTPWQTDTSIGKKSWGYITNEEYRTAEQFIGALVDIVSKNGNLLLNVGPQADGTIPDEAKETLLNIGKWLSKYGDAIYSTRPWVVSGEGPTNSTDDSFTYQEGDIRFTRSKENDKLYITSLAGISDDKLEVTTLKSGKWDTSTIDKISIINSSERKELEWKQTENALEINVPHSDEPFSVEITFADDTIPLLATSAQKNANPENAFETNAIVSGHSIADGSYTAIADDDDAYIKQRISFDNFNAGQMSLELSGDSKGTVTVYNDKTNEIIAEFEVKKDNKNDYRTVSSIVSGIETNTDIDLRIEMSKGIELLSFCFSEKKEANSIIDASDFDEANGAVRSETTADTEYQGESLGYVASGDYVLYKNVDFGENTDKLILRAGADNKNFKVYIDKMSAGNVIAKGNISTGGYNNYETLTFEISNVIGIHDVYIEFVDDAINLNWFLFGDENINA